MRSKWDDEDNPIWIIVGNVITFIILLIALWAISVLLNFQNNSWATATYISFYFFVFSFIGSILSLPLRKGNHIKGSYLVLIGFYIIGFIVALYYFNIYYEINNYLVSLLYLLLAIIVSGFVAIIILFVFLMGALGSIMVYGGVKEVKTRIGGYRK